MIVRRATRHAEGTGKPVRPNQNRGPSDRIGGGAPPKFYAELGITSIIPPPGLCRLSPGSSVLPCISLLDLFERGDII